ncbi:MAG: AAA family ATPase [Bacillota bacterium]|nr:AAA family ATPase [Bacillota bacterium]
MKLHHLVTGRDKELEKIIIQFDTVLQGHSAWTVIAGDIGIGKTALVKTALADLSSLNATCVYGKFEQYKNEEPYIPIIQIIEGITNHILTLPQEKLGQISKNLKNQLGKDGTLLSEVVPQIAKITGRHKKTRVPDYQKLKIRLAAAFQTFITVAAKELYPLIIVVDDLQWADRPSWDIIKAINDPLSEHDIYIILAYRNNLEEYRTRIKSITDELAGNESILEINLESLSYEAIEAMLGDIFNHHLENVSKLAQLLHRKTLGNPFYIKQIIKLFLDNKQLCYKSQKIWRLESENLETLNFSSGMGDMINRKINSLNHQQKEFVETLACIGSKFSMELLGKIIKTENNLIADNLQALCRAGLIVETFEHPREGQPKEFEFFL